MAWSNKSISLAGANDLFAEYDVAFAVDEIEGGYVATCGDRRIRRQTLSGCAKAVLNELINRRARQE